MDSNFPGSAVLLGFIENHGIPTDWRFQVGRTKAYGHHVGEGEEGPAYNLDRPVEVGRLIDRLQQGRIYHYGRWFGMKPGGRSAETGFSVRRAKPTSAAKRREKGRSGAS